MANPKPAKILRLHFCEGDRYADGPLHEAILARCRELNIAGATVFQGLEGYGETAEIHRHHLMTHDQPLVVIVIDTPENIERLLPVVAEMMTTGVIAASDVEMIRCEKPKPGILA
jgi:PII-like signaling protein